MVNKSSTRRGPACFAGNPLTGIREAIALLSQAYDQAQAEPNGRLVAAETLEAAAALMDFTAVELRFDHVAEQQRLSSLANPTKRRKR